MNKMKKHAERHGPGAGPRAEVAHAWPELTVAQCRRLLRRFPNPYCDQSDPSFGEEIVILNRLLRGDELHNSRHYISEIDSYAVSFWWPIKSPPWGEQQYDGPVFRLLGRQLIRPVRCAGGMTWMVLTEEAKAAIAKLEVAHAALQSGAYQILDLPEDAHDQAPNR